MDSHQSMTRIFLMNYFRGSFVMSGLILLSCCVGSTRAADGEPLGDMRTWRDAGGKEIRAALIKIDQETVLIRREDGKEFSVPANRLSGSDQEYIDLHRYANPFEPRAIRPGSTPANLEKPGPSSASVKRPAAADALVLITHQRDDRPEAVFPGIIFHRAGNLAYIVSEGLDEGFREQVLAPANDRFTVSWGAGREHRGIAAQRVALLRKQNKWIYSAPSEKLPPPLMVSKSAVKKNSAVQLVGYELSQGSPPALAPLATTGKFQSREMNRFYNQERLVIEADSKALRHWFVVLGPDQEALGFVLKSYVGSSQSQIQAIPADSLNSLREPEVTQISFAAIKGDAEFIEYEFLVYLADPFQAVKKPRLIVKNVGGPLTSASLGGIDQPANPDAKNISGGTELGLARQQGSQASIQQIQVPRDAVGDPWVGQLKTQNPGNMFRHAYMVQLVYTSTDGKLVNLTPQRLNYAPGQNFDRMRPDVRPFIPDIPGLDGKPASMPRAKELPDGGWLLTSSVTQLKDLPSPVKEDWPKPKAGSGKLTRAPLKRANVTYRELKLPVSEAEGFKGLRRGPTPMAWSADGLWLYVADAKNQLHKINAKDWSEDKVLDLGQPCFHLVESREGLLLRLEKTVWLVAAETLEVKREFTLPGLYLIAAAPKSSQAFAMTKHELDADRHGKSELVMLDLAAGKPLHRIKGYYGDDRYDANILRAGNEKLLADREYGSLTMTADGRNLYFSSRRLHRLRLEGQNLIFETVGPDLGSSSSSAVRIFLSGDGKWVGVPAGQGHAALLFDTQRLDRDKLRAETGEYPSAMGFEAKGSYFCAPTSKDMLVFDMKGNKLDQFKLPAGEVRSLIMHPLESQFLLWCEDKLFVCSLSLNAAAEK